MNLTPLIDVVFVVLIMFILVAPMLELDRVNLAEGAATEQRESTSPSPLAIYVEADNTILINKSRVSPQNLSPILKILHAKHPKQPPQLFQDRKAEFGTYQMVKNAVEEAGYTELEVVLKPAP